MKNSGIIFANLALAIFGLLLGFCTQASAQLIGSSIRGYYVATGNTQNQNAYDPQYGLVPSDCLNAATTPGEAPTVTISNSAIEFCAAEPSGIYRQSADFADTELIVHEQIFTNSLNVGGYTLTFVDPIFAGLEVVRTDSDATPIVYGISGDTLTLQVPGFEGVTNLEARFAFSPVTQILVTIDIKPGGVSNSINPRSRGVTTVAILSTPTFNSPIVVVRESLTFGRTGNEDSLAFCSGAEDVNDDGIPDLVCHFYTSALNFQRGDVQGILKGLLLDGREIVGTDTVTIVGH